MMGEVSAALKSEGLDIDGQPRVAGAAGALLRRIADGTISNKIAKEVFAALWDGEGDADASSRRRV